MNDKNNYLSFDSMIGFIVTRENPFLIEGSTDTRIHNRIVVIPLFNTHSSNNMSKA